jgi:glycyl-tRNA synthetase
MANYEEVMKLALERGFYFPSCEIYSDAPAGFWEYGPTGVSMKNKFVELWRRELVRRDGMIEIDGSQIMSKSVFVASGHIGNFIDPIVKCTKCVLLSVPIATSQKRQARMCLRRWPTKK